MLLLTFAFVLSTTVLAGAVPLSLEWLAHLGPATRFALYSAAICPDGTYYLSDGRGSLAVVDAAGKVLARPQAAPVLERRRLLACDDGGDLYLGGGPGDGLTVFRRGVSGSYYVVRRIETPVAPIHLALNPNSTILASGFLPGSPFPLHALAPGGAVLYSFGEPGSAFVLPRRPPEGWVIRLPDVRVAFIPRLENEVFVYDGRGRLLDRIGIPGSGPINPAQGVQRPAGIVTGAAAMPNGGFALQTRNGVQFWTADLVPRDSAASPGGLLSGADAAGNLYFTAFGADGITVRKAANPTKKPGRQRFLANRASGVPLG